VEHHLHRDRRLGDNNEKMTAMQDDYKKLIPQFKNSPVLNKLLDAFNAAFQRLDTDIAEAFSMLDIDKCEGEYLDNLGALVGVSRPVLSLGDHFLKTDDALNSFENTNYYVMNAPINDNFLLVPDDYYRMLIKAQIFKNNQAVFSVNVLEQCVKILFFLENITIFYVEISGNTLTVHINKDLSHNTLYFLQSFKTDALGRKKFDFPWPPSINQINIEEE
jgi:hypothetical protein